MGSDAYHLEEPGEIRMMLQRICREGGKVRLRQGSLEHEVVLRAELEDRFILDISDVQRGQWQLKAGSRMLLVLEDRGKRYEAVVEMQGYGRFEGGEACAFLHPRVVKCLNTERLADYWPEPPLSCTYNTHGMEIVDGRIRALGMEGVQLAYGVAEQKKGLLRLGDETVLGMVLGRELSLVAPCRVAHFGDGHAGLCFRTDGDQSFRTAYRRWLEEALRGQAQRDRQGFDASGARPKGPASGDEARRTGSAAQVLVDRDPLLLVIAEGEAFPRHMAEALGRKFGIASLDYVQGRVQESLPPIAAGGWGRIRLLLIHQRLRVRSGLELTRVLVQEEGCPLPILVAGLEEDVALKRNRAIASGAVDFISVEPFHVLRVMKSIEDTLRMF
jgi:hypothetical protein